MTGPQNVYNETLSFARVRRTIKLPGDPWKLVTSLMVLQLRDLISIYLGHNVRLTEKRSTGGLTCFIKWQLHSHNQVGAAVIVILATRHGLTSDTTLLGMVLSNSCSQHACLPHQHTLSDLYHHGKRVCLFLDGTENVTQRSYFIEQNENKMSWQSYLNHLEIFVSLWCHPNSERCMEMRGAG